MSKIKILLGAVKAGQGHISLRDFLLDELKKDDSFKLINFEHPGKALESMDERIHNIAPMFHELTYFFSPRYFSDFFLLGTMGFFKECYKILKESKPDIVLSTHFVLSQHFSLANKILKGNALIVNCIPDYGPPGKLMYPKFKPFRADKIMVFEDWTRQGAIKNFSLKPEDVVLAGFNPKPIFKQTAEKFGHKYAAREKLKEIFNYIPYTDIDPNKTTILVTAGSIYARKTIPLLQDIAREQREDLSLLNKFQFFVICGRDNKIFTRLINRNKKFRYWSNIFPMPWVDSQVFAQIQYACDFPILGSIAPATLNELLEVECGPLLIYKTRPGQELPHRAFIEEKGLGVFIPDPKKLIEQLVKGFTPEERGKFLERGRAFRLEQSKRAAELPAIIHKLYQEHKETLEKAGLSQGSDSE